MNFDDLLTESDVLSRWPNLTQSELRRARRANPPMIGYYAFRKSKGGPCYTPKQVQDYINRIYLRVPKWEEPPTPQDDLKSADTISTSPTRNAEDTGTPVGTTSELARSAADRLRQQISNRRKSRSPVSSPPPRKVRGKDRLTLVKS